MERSHETEGVCKKIYHAIGSNCASGKSNRSDSPPLPPPPEAASSVESLKVHIESVPIVARNEGKLQPDRMHQINGRRVGHVSIAIPNHPISSHEHKSREGNHENMYSDYIIRMKNKMGIINTKVGVGGEKTKNVKPANRLASTGRRDSFNEKIVHFINRGRKKIRGPPNLAED